VPKSMHQYISNSQVEFIHSKALHFIFQCILLATLNDLIE